MATLANVLAFSRAETQTNSNGLTDANGIIFANEALLDFRRRLISAGVDASQLQETYRDGEVPSSGNGSTFLYPSDMFWLKAIEVNFVNTNAQDYKTAQQVDVANLPSGNSFSYLRKNADRNNPLFDDRGDWYEIFPAFTTSDNLTNAIRIFYFLKPTEYSATSDTIAYPESLDYRIVGWRICHNYFYSLGKFDEAERYNMKYEQRVKELIATLSRGSQQPLQANPLGINGFEF